MTDENRPTNASISTMWAIDNYPDLNDFLTITRQLGFQKIELNHQIDSKILSRVNFDHNQISSVHEPCPADIPTKELVDRDWLISAIDEDARTLGVNAVKKSIDLACQLGSAVVVIHCGTIPFTENHESKLRILFHSGDTQSREYLRIKKQFEISREKYSGPRLQSVMKSLKELIDYAARCRVKLGLENRYHYMDIPSIDEMGELLNLADSRQLGFVYDVGHAQALDRLGFYPHEDWLERYTSRMFGCHLHDVIGVADHYAPGLGEIDFKFIAKYLPDGIFKTIEILPGNTLAHIRDGVKRLVEAGCIQYL